MGFAPFAHAQVIKEIATAPAAKLVLAHRLALFFETSPEIDECGEIRGFVGPLRMRLIGGLLSLDRALARILHRQAAGNDQQLFQAILIDRFEKHATDAGIDRQARQLSADVTDRPATVHRSELLQQREAIADGAAIRRLDKREILDPAQAQVQHLQDHCSQIGAQDLRIGKRRPAVEVFLAV